ncbi:hypothetical protein Fmac_028107 [Flemingia macrophylla]|uniref:3'-5' exonuclease domain-containing protein n=1 Tax=Flemingia macrophylla TaxID=520843 RepID=A0ABD1LJL5_9FABA
MYTSELFNLDGVLITTHVTTKVKIIDDILESLLYPADSDEIKVIGFDIEWCLSNEDEGSETKPTTKCATLHLCDENTCLIIQLLHMYRVPVSLLNFLRLPDYTFVGVGIKENLNKFEKYYGIRCRNAVELGPLAASVMKMPRLSACGIDELALVVSKLNIRRHRPLSVVFNNWGHHELSKKLAKLATVNVYSYFNVGSKLLAAEAD